MESISAVIMETHVTGEMGNIPEMVVEDIHDVSF